MEHECAAATPTRAPVVSSQTWPGVVDEQEAESSRMSARPKWALLTDGEQYVASLGTSIQPCCCHVNLSKSWLLERRLKNAKPSKRKSSGRGSDDMATGHDCHGAKLQLDPNVRVDMVSDTDSDPEDVPQALVHENTETTSLLYDARRQQLQWERDIREQKARTSSNHSTHSETTTMQERASHARDATSSSTKSHNHPVEDRTRHTPRSRRISILETASQSPGEHATPSSTPTLPSDRIHFSDSVRISGGVRSERGRRGRKSITASSVFQVPDNATHDMPSHSAEVSPMKPSSNRGSPRGSVSRNFDRVTSLSRPASFVSEEGRSRASTPASIYAPLLAPSKSAPSPRRHFYLTFQRDDGQATYRELVRRQSLEVRRKRREHRQRRRSAAGRQAWYGRSKGGQGEDLDSEDQTTQDESDDFESDSDDGGGFGCLCGLRSWTCGLSRVWRNRGRRQRRPSFRGSRANNPERDSMREEWDSASEDSYQDGRPEHKSEVNVLFGQRPWRYFDRHYWMFRWRELSRRTPVEED